MQTVSTRKSGSSSDVGDPIKHAQLHKVGSSTFHFLVPFHLYNTEKPYLSRLPSGTKLPRTNIVTESHVLTVLDVSGHESDFTLEKSGFQYAKSPIHMEQWNDLSVCSEYIPRVEEWLVKHLNCSSAFIYAYNVSSDPRVQLGSGIAEPRRSSEGTIQAIPRTSPPRLHSCVHIAASVQILLDFRTSISTRDTNG